MADGAQDNTGSDGAKLVVAEQQFSLAPKTFDEAMKWAQIAAKSTIVPRAYQGRPSDILLAVQMGAEVGLQPLQALQNIATINGRPSLWGDAMLALCRASASWGEFEESFDKAEMRYTCRAKPRGDSHWTEHKFARADAELAGLWNKTDAWKKYPQRMLQMRARGFALRDAYPHVLRGLGCAEEQRDIAEVKHAGSSERDARSLHDGEAPEAKPISIEPEVLPAKDEAPPQSSELKRVLSCIEGAQMESSLQACQRDARQLCPRERDVARQAFIARLKYIREREAKAFADDDDWSSYGEENNADGGDNSSSAGDD